MVKAGKWFKSFLVGRKEKNQEKDVEKSIWMQLPPLTPPPPPPTTPKEITRSKRSFNHDWKKANCKEQFSPPAAANRFTYSEPMAELRRHSIAVASAREAASAYAGRRTGRRTRFVPIEEIAAIKIQSLFRSYLARKALLALKGVVKLQAVVRGLLARKQATAAAAALRSTQSSLMAQSRPRIHRAQLTEIVNAVSWRESFERRIVADFKSLQLDDMQKTVETDSERLNISSRHRKSTSTIRSETKEPSFFTNQKTSTSPSDLTYTGLVSNTTRVEDASFGIGKAYHKLQKTSSSEESAIQDEPHHISHESLLYPNYMANTESWRAKARSQTAPKQRPESADQRQSNRRRAFDRKSFGRVTSSKEHHAWHDELDKSLTNEGHCRFLVA